MDENILEVRSLMFLKMAVNYLQIVETISGELISQGNNIVILTDYQITPEEFEEKTKWNDYKIAEPFSSTFITVWNYCLRDMFS